MIETRTEWEDVDREIVEGVRVDTRDRGELWARRRGEDNWKVYGLGRIHDDELLAFARALLDRLDSTARTERRRERLAALIVAHRDLLPDGISVDSFDLECAGAWAVVGVDERGGEHLSVCVDAEIRDWLIEGRMEPTRLVNLDTGDSFLPVTTRTVAWEPVDGDGTDVCPSVYRDTDPARGFAATPCTRPLGHPGPHANENVVGLTWVDGQ